MIITLLYPSLLSIPHYFIHPFFIPVELLSYCQLMGLLAEASEKAFPYPLALNPMQNAVIRNYMQVH